MANVNQERNRILFGCENETPLGNKYTDVMEMIMTYDPLYEPNN